MIMFICLFILSGIVPSIILKFFSRPMALSTWILDLAIRRVFVVAFDASCLPLPKGGMFKVAPRNASKSRIKNPRSAMMSSFGSM